jgi:hypothetical protein
VRDGAESGRTQNVPADSDVLLRPPNLAVQRPEGSRRSSLGR